MWSKVNCILGRFWTWKWKEIEVVVFKRSGTSKIKHANIVVKGGTKWKLLATHIGHVLEENETGTATQQQSQLMKYCQSTKISAPQQLSDLWWQYWSRLTKWNRKVSAVFNQLQPVWSSKSFTIKTKLHLLCPPQPLQVIHEKVQLQATKKWMFFNNAVSETSSTSSGKIEL